MADRLKIELLSQPTPFSLLNVAVSTSDTLYYRQVLVTFLSGIPANSSAVQIGSTLEITIARLFANLLANHADIFTFWTLEEGIIYLNFYTDVEIIVSYTPYVWLLVTTDSVTIVPVEVLPDFETGFFTLEIIDTYENDRTLVEEIAQANAPILKYDGGDDIYEPFMSSTLDFNLLVKDKSDAKFFHLFTGDENRYRVRLSNTDPSENVQLLWQGFLLPDQYKEPYKNGAFFVAFTAVDMISTLKGKELEPWFYHARFTLPEIVSMLLKLTGLEQRIWVKPAIVNSSILVGWKNIIVNMEPFVKDGKYQDAYKILESILVSQCLVLKSWRGEWCLEGFTRRGEVTGDAVYFDHDGTYLGMASVTKKQVSFMQQAESVNLTAVTPFKKVSVGFAYDEKKNLFPDDVVIRDSFFAGYNGEEFDRNTPTTTYFRQWKKVGGSYMTFLNFTEEFSFRNINPAIPYNVSEAESLANYFECQEKPYVSPGRVYEFEFEVDFRTGWGLGLTLNNYMEYMNNGTLDRLPIFQILLDGAEIRSNRPSSPTLSQNTYDERLYDSYVVNQGTLGSIVYRSTYRIKREFTVSTDGNITFRMLAPRYASGGFDLRYFEVIPKILKINVIEGDKEENIEAVRDINYTEVKDVDLPITCSVNAAVPNSFAIGERVGANTKDVPMAAQTDAVFTQVFPPINNLDLNFRKMEIGEDVSAYLFDLGRTKSVYLEKASGERIHFYSLYVKLGPGPLIGRRNLYYLVDWEGRPKIPKDFKRLPIAGPGDQIKILLSDFTAENFSLRESWHVYGIPGWTEDYPKTVANAYHSTRKEPIFNLETSLLGLLYPDQLFDFFFADEMRSFVPTRIEIDLFGGKTKINAKQTATNEITDIIYE